MNEKEHKKFQAEVAELDNRGRSLHRDLNYKFSSIKKLQEEATELLKSFITVHREVEVATETEARRFAIDIRELRRDLKEEQNNHANVQDDLERLKKKRKVTIPTRPKDYTHEELLQIAKRIKENKYVEKADWEAFEGFKFPARPKNATENSDYKEYLSILRKLGETEELKALGEPAKPPLPPVEPVRTSPAVEEALAKATTKSKKVKDTQAQVRTLEPVIAEQVTVISDKESGENDAEPHVQASPIKLPTPTPTVKKEKARASEDSQPEKSKKAKKEEEKVRKQQKEEHEKQEERHRKSKELEEQKRELQRKIAELARIQEQETGASEEQGSPRNQEEEGAAEPEPSTEDEDDEVSRLVTQGQKD